MTATEETLTVTRNEQQNRYELYAGDTLAGFAAFETTADGRVRFTHTQIDRAFRGRGLADVLASDALSDVAQRGEAIVPICPFIASYLKDNEIAGAVIDWPNEDDAEDAATPGESPA
ncbi:N-acetyltransferase [Microbacterium sp. LRZ72]|uniref:GNAT family N-acetyltransferase n=1 Tax=Microbacterium sp. LRZ72 TaxID=2942481 RepID=UPI0029AAE170|nr:GNAT family N-acetyltransferase [Microbacterium sp. LRZ72]MDX2377480.1 N-acetyltransferase [Microbacterium sp. LRZ72]